MKSLIVLLLLTSPCFAAVTLTDNANDYTVQNEYYKAVIPKTGNNAAGLVKHLYVFKADGTMLSGDLIYQTNSTYGLGWLEGGLDAGGGNNDAVGLGFRTTTAVTILSNTSSRVVIQATLSSDGNMWTETWTFSGGLAYFQGDAYAVRTDAGAMVNQFQFCWMVNQASVNTWGTNASGTPVQFTRRTTHSINSPLITSTYPWVNYEYTTETVSLGMIFTDLNHKLVTQAETADWQYEYQFNWGYGAGIVGVPVQTGNTRHGTTVYYTQNAASHTGIAAFASAAWAKATPSSVQDPQERAAYLVNNPTSQNAGYGSAIMNSPYWLVRQNAQSGSGSPTYPQYATSFYGPLWTSMQQVNNNEDYNFHVAFTLNYDNDSTPFPYGTVTPSAATNGATTSIVHSATSNDGKLSYAATLATYGDSDHLSVTGTASNASSSAPVKDIWVDLLSSFPVYFLAPDFLPANQVTGTLSAADGLWTNYSGYGGTMPEGSFSSSLIYNDASETVQPVHVATGLPSGVHNVTACMRQSTTGVVTYKYSTDGSSYTEFTVPANATGPYCQSFEALSTGANFYLGQGVGGARRGTYAGLQSYLQFTPAWTSLGSNVYDLQWTDKGFGQVGVAVKVNSPTGNITLSAGGDDLRVYLYRQASAQTLTAFTYGYDIDIWAHAGWLSSAEQFTALHTQAPAAYTRRIMGATGALAF